MIDDIREIASETRSGTVEGVPVMFRAYIAHDHTERLVWRIDETTANGAMLDKVDALVILPQGREIDIGGRMTHYVSIPRWMADALMNDFEDFETDSIELIGDDEVPEEVIEDFEVPVVEEDDEDIKPMFDDIPVDDDDDSN